MADDSYAKCGHKMKSGMTCDLIEGHDGEHFDRFGLRDPKPTLSRGDPA